jgi:hypothetical protein
MYNTIYLLLTHSDGGTTTINGVLSSSFFFTCVAVFVITFIVVAVGAP